MARALTTSFATATAARWPSSRLSASPSIPPMLPSRPRTTPRQLNVPYVFLTNGKEIRFWEWRSEAYPHPVKTFFKQDDLERRVATPRFGATR